MRMSWNDWAKSGWLRPHKTSKEEIISLLEIVTRDLKDAETKGLSEDWKFGIAYNAALKLCTIALHSSGFRPEKNLAHYRTLHSLPLTLGDRYKPEANYLDLCRKKRNETEYNFAGNISKDEALELIEFCKELKTTVIAWLNKYHKNLVS